MPARLVLARLARTTALALSLSHLAALAAGPAVAEPAPVDESALRYYASLKQSVRVEAESRRLERAHPGWHPPADLWSARPATADEAPLWALFGADRLDALKGAIAARARAEPGWRPSDDLANQLRRKELRLGVTAAVREGRHAEAAALALKERAILDAGDAALAWAAAEAFARTERPEEASALLRAGIEAPRATPAERLGHVQKALALLPVAEAERLVALAAARGAPGELAGVALDLTRARIGALLHDEPATPVAPAEMQAFQDFARASDDPNQAGLVAWYAFKRRDHAEALTWFKLAIARGGDAMVAHGLAHTLHRLGLAREAEEVAYAWREPLVNNAILFVDLLEAEMTREVPAPIEPERVRRLAEVVLATGSGEGAQALAWYAHNTCQFDTALDWFRRATAWYPKEATVLGYAVTLRRLKRTRDFVELVNRYDGLFPRVVDLLFDTRPPSPLPCERSAAAKPAAAAAVAAAGPYLDIAPPDPGRRAGSAGWGRVPAPEEAGGARAALPVVRRAEFPVAVGPENELRYPSVAPGTGSDERRWRERAAVGAALVARRVPGVGAMPYERYGFSLLPAWNGTDGPGVPSAERPPPAGTLWAEERGARPAERPAGAERPAAALTEAARFQH